MRLRDVEKHLEFLMDGYKNSYFWEVRLVKNGVKRGFFKTKEEIIEFLKRQNAENKNVLIGLLPRKEKGGRKESVAEANTFVIDIDFDYIAEDKIGKEIYVKLAENFIKPSLVVKSGRGFHVYWKINENIEPKKWERIQKGLIKKVSEIIDYKVDKQLIDCSRVIRLAGTNNVKEKILPCYILIEDYSTYDKKYFEELEIKEVKIEKIEIPKIRKGKLKIDEIIKAFKGFWVEGHRNNLTLWLIGALIKLGYPKEVCHLLIDKITDVYKDEEKRHRLYSVEYQYSRIGKVNFKGVSGLIDEFIEIAKEQNANEIKAINRARKILKLIGIKKSEYLPKVVEKLILAGKYNYKFFNYFSKISEEARIKLIEMAIGKVKKEFLVKKIRKISSERERLRLLLMLE